MSGRPTLPSRHAPVKSMPDELSGSRASGAKLGRPSAGPVKFHWSEPLKSLGIVKLAEAAAGNASASRAATRTSTRAFIRGQNARRAGNLRCPVPGPCKDRMSGPTHGGPGTPVGMSQNVAQFLLNRVHSGWGVKRIYGYPG